jgi:hypothetical protein
MTSPSLNANKVKSFPWPTPTPAWNLFPNCLTMMFPASHFCSPNSFTPRYFAFESRPFLTDPVPFLCAASIVNANDPLSLCFRVRAKKNQKKQKLRQYSFLKKKNKESINRANNN